DALDEVLGHLLTGVEGDSGIEPLPHLGPGDLRGRGVLHEAVDGHGAVALEPGAQVLDADGDVRAQSCSVIDPGVDLTSRRSAAVTSTSSRLLSIWLGLSPRVSVKTSLHWETMPGWATQEPSKPSPAS